MVRQRFEYQYELDERSGDFRCWQSSQRLVRWDWIDVGPNLDGKALERVWLALRRAGCAIEATRSGAEAPFTVRIAVRPPAGRPAAPAAMIKGLLDGVICAFQAHTDSATVTDVATRLTRTLAASQAELQGLLVDRARRHWRLCLGSCTLEAMGSRGHRLTNIASQVSSCSNRRAATAGRCAASSTRSDPDTYRSLVSRAWRASV